MENGAAGEQGGSHPGKQLFNAVYDPRFDKFFLEDEAVYRGRSRIIERKSISIPWDKWILPPKSPSKRTQQGNAKHKDFQPVQAPAIDSIPVPATETSALITTKTEGKIGYLDDNAGQDNQTVTVPALDFSSVQQQLTDASTSSADHVVTAKPKKTRVQDYTAHFNRTNQDVAMIMAAGVVNAEPNDEHEIKWNGEVLHVQFPVVQHQPEITAACISDVDKPDALQQEIVRGSANEKWPGSTYELKHLLRIRAHADGLRGVNLANRFVAVSSSESSDSEEEVKIPTQQESEDESELMPVFFRDDRVLFHAKRRWFKGTVRRRIPKSDFYNISADNGSLFEAILASKMELLDEPEEPPYYDYARGDKVLWVPDINDTTTNSSTKRHRSNNVEEELTYKAKIVQVRSLERFDLLLRTGRVVKKVPYKQLCPRDVSDFVSTTTSRRR